MNSKTLLSTSNRLKKNQELGVRLSTCNIEQAKYLNISAIRDYQMNNLDCIEDEVLFDFFDSVPARNIKYLGLDLVNDISDLYMAKIQEKNKQQNLWCALLKQPLSDMDNVIGILKKRDDYRKGQLNGFDFHGFNVNKSQSALYIDKDIIIFGKQDTVETLLDSKIEELSLNYWDKANGCLFFHYSCDVGAFLSEFINNVSMDLDLPFLNVIKNARYIISKSSGNRVKNMLDGIKNSVASSCKESLYFNVLFDFDSAQSAEEFEESQVFISERLNELKHRVVSTKDKHLIDLINGLKLTYSKKSFSMLSCLEQDRVRYFYTNLMDSPTHILNNYAMELLYSRKTDDNEDGEREDGDVLSEESVNSTAIDFPAHMTPDFFRSGKIDFPMSKSHPINSHFNIMRVAEVNNQVYIDLQFEDKESMFLSAFTRSHSIKALSVLNADKKELEQDVEKSTPILENGLNFGDNRIVVASVVLDKQVSISDISELSGLTEIRLPENVLRQRLTVSDLGKSVNFSGNRAEILSWGQSNVSYYLFMSKDTLLDIRVLNHDDKVLHYGGGSQSERTFAGKGRFFQHQFVSGKAACLEIIYTPAYRNYTFPFSLTVMLDGIQSSSYQTSIYDEMPTLDDLEKKYYTQRYDAWTEHTRDEVFDNKIYHLTPAMAGPMNIYCIEAKNRYNNFEVQLQIKGPDEKSLHRLKGLIKLRLEKLYSAEKILYESDWGNDTEGYVETSMDYWRNELKSDMTLQINGSDTYENIDKISLSIIITLPANIQKIDLNKFILGEKIHINNHTFEVQEYVNGWFQLASTKDMPSIVDVKSLTLEDKSTRIAGFKIDNEKRHLFLPLLGPREYYRLYLSAENTQQVYHVDVVLDV